VGTAKAGELLWCHHGVSREGAFAPEAIARSLLHAPAPQLTMFDASNYGFAFVIIGILLAIGLGLAADSRASRNRRRRREAELFIFDWTGNTPRSYLDVPRLRDVWIGRRDTMRDMAGWQDLQVHALLSSCEDTNIPRNLSRCPLVTPSQGQNAAIAGRHDPLIYYPRLASLAVLPAASHNQRFPAPFKSPSLSPCPLRPPALNAIHSTMTTTTIHGSIENMRSEPVICVLSHRSVWLVIPLHTTPSDHSACFYPRTWTRRDVCVLLIVHYRRHDMPSCFPCDLDAFPSVSILVSGLQALCCALYLLGASWRPRHPRSSFAIFHLKSAVALSKADG
jgi:hypothetical protein